MKEIEKLSSDELFNKYDYVVNAIMINLYTLSKDQKKITLTNIDRKNTDHLLVLRVALIAKDICGYSISLDTDFWTWLILNWKMRKLTKKMSREKKCGNVDVPELLKYMYPYMKEIVDEDFEFAHIYNQFYGKD